MKSVTYDTPARVHRRQGGFSLVEIMIAITLSLIVLAGVLAVMYSSKVTYAESERVGRLQESGRAAVDLMLRDLRGAGFPGCAQPIEGLFALNNILTNPTDVFNNFAEPAFGYEGTGGTWSPALDGALFPSATAGNDVLVIRTTPSGSPSMRVTALVDTADTSITVSKSAGEMLDMGRPAVISDCGNATVFEVQNFTPGGGDLTGTIARSGSANLGADYRPGARVIPVVSVGYYVAPDTAGTGTSLWRVVDGEPAQEMIPGVEALEVRYGVDTDAGSDVTVNQYVDADAVTDWSRVISVSLAILIRSGEQTSPTVDTSTYRLLETDLGPFNDRFQRSVFTTTVTLRNTTT
jgi:type IV pilus assembly protein PilW